MIKRFIEKIKRIKATRSSKNYIDYLRSKGIIDELLDKKLIIKQIWGVKNYEAWKNKHKPTFENFDDFLKAAGI